MTDQAVNKDLSREDLNALAVEAGVENPEALPNKDAVIAAIEEVRPASGDGESAESSGEAPRYLVNGELVDPNGKPVKKG